MRITTKAAGERRSAALLGVALGAAMLLATASACGAEPTATPPATATAAPADASTAAPIDAPTEQPAAAPDVGADAGNSLPHFEMTLVDGSKVSTELLAAQGRPVFLYFFSTW